MKRGYSRGIVRTTDADLADLADLHRLFWDAAGSDVGDFLASMQRCVQLARDVRSESIGNARFSSAEVDITLANTLREVSAAADRTEQNLRDMLEALRRTPAHTNRTTHG